MVGIDPLASDAGADVGLILMVAGDDLDRCAKNLAAKVIDGHLRGEHTALAGDIGVKTRHIVEHAELDDSVRDLRPGRSTAKNADGDRQAK